MTKLLETAIQAVRKLSAHEQDHAAELLLHLTQTPSATDIYEVTADERAALEESVAQMATGQYASEEKVAALWKKCGL